MQDRCVTRVSKRTTNAFAFFQWAFTTCIQQVFHLSFQIPYERTFAPQVFPSLDFFKLLLQLDNGQLMPESHKIGVSEIKRIDNVVFLDALAM